MASFKMMSSSTSRNSDLSRRNSSSASSSPSIKSHNLRRDPHAADHQSKLSFGNDWTIHDDVDRTSNGDRNSVNGGGRKSVDDIWKEIISGERKTIVMKEEAQEQQEEDTNIMMTLEDFLAKAEAMDNDDSTNRDSDEIDVKMEIQPFDDHYPMIPQQHNPFQMIEGSGSGSMRGKRGRVLMMEATMDKAAAQRQKRMIKNRESAARSRERKQAYQVELETLARKLEQENEQLSKEIEEKTKDRYKKLMEQLVPVVEKQGKPSLARSLHRSHSLEW